jgi:hypothetical protein
MRRGQVEWISNTSGTDGNSHCIVSIVSHADQRREQQVTCSVQHMYFLFRFSLCLHLGESNTRRLMGTPYVCFKFRIHNYFQNQYFAVLTLDLISSE